MRLPLFALLLGGAAYAAPTFTKDVAPILYRRCVECHRAGEAAPMALTTYKEVRPFAKAIREAVLANRMPVWLADPEHGKFKNDRSLSALEKETIRQWVAAGAPEGMPQELPPLPPMVTGWNIGKPDRVIDIGREYAVPASGTVPYQYFEVDPGFKEDAWVEAAEIRPDQRSVVHHVIVFMNDANGKPVDDAGGDLLVGWAPGDPPLRLPEGTAMRVKAGTRFRVQMHYTPNGKPVNDRTYFGLRYAKKPPTREAITGRAINTRLAIPAMAADHVEKADWKFRRPVEIISYMPHMHVRGKSFQYAMNYPDGRREVLLDVPKYDFGWQLSYEPVTPLQVPAGARMECEAHYDNSPNNRNNPDPSKPVRWGDQTWEEMMIGWFTYTVPVKGD
ncbi:MAG TPA: thiol-disulfide isomerase [Bryobacteraceae bacterium]|nr:thiol-disulfide isomerase [Bryobacteraceae bacterium]